MMTLRQLRYFSSLARLGHFGRAAEECAVSQPALSVQIQELEAFLGRQLIERRRGGIELTAAGVEIERRARTILTEVRDLVDYARHRDARLAGPLRLGVIPSIAPYLLPGALPVLHKRYPELDLQLRETMTKTLLEELGDGQLDVVLLSLPVDEPAFETIRLFDDAFVLATSAKAAAAHPPMTEPLSRLELRDLLLLEEGHCLREQALTYCRAIRADLRSKFGASSLATIIQMVANGYGSTLLPEIAIASELRADQRIRLVRFADPQPTRTIGLAWRRTSPRKADFVELGRSITEAAAPVIAAASRVLKASAA